MIKFLTIILVFLNPFIFIAHPDIKTDELNKKLTIFFDSFKPDIKNLSRGEVNFEVNPKKLPLSTASTNGINPQLASLTANLAIAASEQANPNFRPIRDWSVAEPETEARATLIINGDLDKVFYQKNAGEVLPIASLTKLMTALMVLENMDLNQEVIISKKAVEAYGDLGGLKIDEKISVKNLLYIMLLESSNDAATALAENLPNGNLDNFINLMNQKANELGIENTRFIDSTGYDPSNVSTALDLAKLIKYSLSKPLVWDILKTPVIDLFSVDEKINHHLVNNNQLLNRLPEMIGGKTGYTEEANECMLSLIRAPDKTNLVIVVLGAKDRFLETEKLANWAKEAYIW